MRETQYQRFFLDSDYVFTRSMQQLNAFIPYDHSALQSSHSSLPRVNIRDKFYCKNRIVGSEKVEKREKEIKRSTPRVDLA